MQTTTLHKRASFPSFGWVGGGYLLVEEGREYFWDEQNRLRSAVLNGGKMMHYIYDASGERTLKAQTEYQGVFENGIPTDEGSTLNSYTTYPSPFITISPDNNYTNHYYAGSQRIASKPVGKANIFNDLQEEIIELNELKSRQLADAQFVADSMELGQLNLAQPESGIIIIPAVFYFHPDHLGSSTLITDNFGDPYQFFLNLPFGANKRKSHAVFLEVCERSSMAEQRRSGSFNNSYKFNGKELDEETGLYYYGARYYNPRTSVWLSVDPIALWQPVQEVEHYIEGQHNGGYFNPQNMNVYGYTYQNPVRYVDPNGKQVDAVLKSQEEIDEFTKNGTQKAKWDNVKNLQNAFQVNGHGNSKYMLNYIDGKGVGKIDGPISFNKRFEDNEKWQSNKNRKGFKLILHSCNVGNGENSLAARISKYYENISVIAPTRYLWGTDSQFTGVYDKDDKGNKDLKNPGYWIIYQRGIAVGAYDATWYPGASTKEHKVDLKDIPSSHYDGEIGEKDYSKYKFKKDDK